MEEKNEFFIIVINSMGGASIYLYIYSESK